MRSSACVEKGTIRRAAGLAFFACLLSVSCGGPPPDCRGDPCCGDPCCGDPCCGDPCCGDPCCGDPCCGDPCCGDPCCGDPSCAQPASPSSPLGTRKERLQQSRQ